ncbi:MAG: hypothetical protein ACXWZM_09995, partial [Solirubrobacterales bacterium]
RTAGLDGFRASLAAHGLSPAGNLPAFELTPLGFLDAIDVEPTPYEAFRLPPNVTRTGESVLVTGFIAQMARDHFAKSAPLQASALRSRVEAMRQKTAPAAHELFDLCLTRFVSREGFESDIHGHLAFDFLYRFQFPLALHEQIFDFLAASLFAAGESVSGLSKIRIVKAIWDRAYEKLLKKHPGRRTEIQALDREMRLRTFRDYLDWEVLHYSILGFAAGNRAHPVAAFTPDPEEVVKARCTAYKTALRAFLDQINLEELATTLRPRLNAWQPGFLGPCKEDGTFEAVISTGDLPVF